MDEDVGLAELEKLLEAAEGQDLEQKAQLNTFIPQLKEDDSFVKAFTTVENGEVAKNAMPTGSKLNDEDIDSSDDEEVRNFLERKYNEYGRDINNKLKQKNQEKKESQVEREVENSIKNLAGSTSSQSCRGWKQSSQSSISTNDTSSAFNKNTKRIAYEGSNKSANQIVKPTLRAKIEENKLNSAVYTDPVFGMRIINPLISSSVLIERMLGRKAVSFSNIQYHIQCGDLKKDWVISGVIVSQNFGKTTKKGDSFSIWSLSDLKGDMKTISLFLFKSAHNDLLNTPVKTVVAILNPGVFEKRSEKNDQACLNIDNSQKVMILGQSKDMGKCKARKKNGETCGSIVNLGECDYCLYHIRQEYANVSKRSELQSATAGRGLNELRNKVLGKNEVFYGGQSYTAVPAKKNPKQIAKDQKRLMTLSEYYQSPNAGTTNHVSTPRMHKEIPYAPRSGPCSKIAGNVEVTTKQRLKDLERLKSLQNENADKPIENEQSVEINSFSVHASSFIPEKFKTKEFSFSQKIPTLSKESFSIELNVTNKQAEMAKQKALQVVKSKPIEKINPNFVKYRGTTDGKKRALAELENSFEKEYKKAKLDQQEDQRKSRIQKMMEATSSHTNLVRTREDEEQEKYFNKLEKKEAMEEKMLTTYKVDCKAVICRQCKYTAFTAAERCKEEKHPLKIVDAEKRFFECQDCGNRTATVYKIPKLSCKNCQSSRWKRAAMIKDKKSVDPSSGLSIRGDEEKFIGSMSTSANLNLLVPEE